MNEIQTSISGIENRTYFKITPINEFMSKIARNETELPDVDVQGKVRLKSRCRSKERKQLSHSGSDKRSKSL